MDNNKDNNFKIDIGGGDIKINLGDIVIPKINKFPKDDIVAMGMFEITRGDLEGLKLQNRKVSLKVTGVLKVNKDVTKELFLKTISKVSVSGIVYASKEVKEVIKRI